MQIQVRRKRSTPLSVGSNILLDNTHVYYGLEPPREASKPGEPVCIPAGTYQVWLRHSLVNKSWVMAVMDVPGRTDIEVHIGNCPTDTHGCLLVGTGCNTDLLIRSHAAFEDIMQRVIECLPDEPITIAFVDDFGTETFTETSKPA